MWTELGLAMEWMAFMYVCGRSRVPECAAITLFGELVRSASMWCQSLPFMRRPCKRVVSVVRGDAEGRDRRALEATITNVLETGYPYDWMAVGRRLSDRQQRR